MGQVILNPVRARFISTSIKVELELKEPQNDQDSILLKGEKISKELFNRQMPNHRNKTIFIEIPIIGSIVNHTSLFSPIEFTELERSNSSAPLPLHAFDLKSLGDQASEYSQSSNLLIRNPFTVPIAIHKIVDNISTYQEASSHHQNDPTAI